MLRKIRVYGKLAKTLGRRVFEAEVASAAEAVRFLLANFPHLEPVLAQGHYRVTAGTYDLSESELAHPIGQQAIKIVPVVSGAGTAGRIILGAVLIAASFFFPAAAGTAAALKIGGSTFTAFGAGLFFAGASLVLSGVAQLLTPTPQLKLTGPDSQDDPRRSYGFSSVQQTSREGVPVPVIYGERIVGSVVISGGIDTVQVQA